MLEKRVVERCWRRAFCREVLGRSVLEQSWGTVLQRIAGDDCCREVLGKSGCENLGKSVEEMCCREESGKSVEKC